MVLWEGFNCGMGIGGWLTNYKRFNVIPVEERLLITVGDMEHFMTYITRDDVQNIAAMGMDHIRLGFDQIVLEETPYVYREAILERIEAFADWCREAGLRVMLNLHKCIGNYCDIPEKVTLFDSEELMDRFIALWMKLEERLAGRDDVAFELLNEVRDLPPEPWNLLAKRAVESIRKVNPTRKIVIGSTNWNSPAKLKELWVMDDPNVGYTYHFYEPFCFTHQRGVLQAAVLTYNREMPYPGDIERYRDYYRFVGVKDPLVGYDRMDARFLEDQLRPVKEFCDAHPDAWVYFGEFGTIRHCKLEWRQNWMRDVIAITKKWGIPYCSWNYLSTPNDGNRFSLVDDDTRKILSPELLKILKGEADGE